MNGMRKNSLFLGWVLLAALIFHLSLGIEFKQADAASNYFRVYPLSTSNDTKVYMTNTLEKRGTSSPKKAYNAVVYASDEMYVYKLTENYAYISYPTSSGRRYGYVKTSDISAMNYCNDAKTSRAGITTYKRAGSGKYGSISKHDSVYSLAKNGNYVQVVYPVGANYKIGWITLSNYNTYINVSNRTKPSLTYQAHVADIGWQSPVSEGNTAGTEGQSKAIESLIINLKDWNGNNGIFYKMHVQDVGWQGWKSTGQKSGTEGQSLQGEAVKIQLSSSLSSYYDIYYRVHVADYGWLGYAKNGEPAGTEGGSMRMEAIQIELVSKGQSFERGGNAYYNLNGIVPNSYGSYDGVDYKSSGVSSQRIAALERAEKMVTVLWTAPCDFVTWQSSKGAYNYVTATDGTVSAKFIKGKQYMGVPYSMADHSYDDTKWLNLVNQGFSSSSMSVKYGNRSATTAHGMDCSYFTYLAFNAAGTGYSCPYQTTKDMLTSSVYSKKSLYTIKPADIALKNGHVMLYVGRSGSDYAFFEADADDSKCSYNVYSASALSSYSIYKFKGFSD